MKNLKQYIKEKLIINKNFREGKIVVKSFNELRKIIEDRYYKLGPGTEDDPIDFNDIDVSNLDSFCNDEYEGIFEKTKFEYIDISDWDVSNITNMCSMFYRCEKLMTIGDISDWDVSSVINMNHMFCGCKYCVCDMSDWDVANVECHYDMFEGCLIGEEYMPNFKD